MSYMNRRFTPIKPPLSLLINTIQTILLRLTCPMNMMVGYIPIKIIPLYNMMIGYP